MFQTNSLFQKLEHLPQPKSQVNQRLSERTNHSEQNSVELITDHPKNLTNQLIQAAKISVLFLLPLVSAMIIGIALAPFKNQLQNPSPDINQRNSNPNLREFNLDGNHDFCLLISCHTP